MPLYYVPEHREQDIFNILKREKAITYGKTILLIAFLLGIVVGIVVAKL